ANGDEDARKVVSGFKSKGAEALNMAIQLLNILPSTAIANDIPYTRLYDKYPNYTLLCIFGCLCYPHIYPSHKLELRVTPSILLGYVSSHRGTNRPTERLNLHVSSVSPLPKSYRDAFSDPNWQNAMRDEYHALIKNKTWTLVPRPPYSNIARCMWLFRHKYLVAGTISRYKGRLVANSSTQLKGVDVDETFSLVVKPGTIRTIFSLATSRHWPIHQLDVKNAFLHGDLSKTVYMYKPPGFQDSVYPDYVCLLLQGTDTAYLLLYVDDIVLTASSKILLH
ncbi:ribonuclease H-like domain-containing protein, partial [Tanacetum coccineum]